MTIKEGVYSKATMRLRSQKTITAGAETPKSSRRQTSETPKQPRVKLPVAESPLQPQNEEASGGETHQSPVEMPKVTRRLLPARRLRKRAMAVEDRDSDLAFQTPARPVMRPKHVLSEIDRMTPRNTTARNIYSPIVRFVTPSKENVKLTETGGVLMSPEQCVFGYGSIDLLGGDEEEDVFNPLRFIKNIPSQSDCVRPAPRDIPPKTRSTPEPTLVVDLEETLMHSSLSVINGAEHTFHTVFQDHQYKVYMILRPHVTEFLQSMAKTYELFVYTCAKKEYAEKILNVLDPQRKLFRHRLYQEDCACVQGHYIKDLSILGRDLAKTVVLDNAPHTYPYHLMNMIPVKSWSREPDDRELQKLIPTLEKLATVEDFRDVLKKRKDHFHRLLSED